MLESVSNKIISFGQLGLVCQDTSVLRVCHWLVMSLKIYHFCSAAKQGVG